MFLTGVLQVFGMLLLAALYNVYVRTASLFFDMKPIVFTSMCLLGTSLALAFVAGPGRYTKSTLMSLQTWVYGLVLIGYYLVDLYLVHYVSGTEMSLVGRMAVPLSLIFGFFIMKRTPKAADLWGCFLILLGFVLFFKIQPEQNLLPVVFLTILSAITYAILFFTTETHPESVKAQTDGNIRDKMRVLAFVSFVTSSLFFCGMLFLSFLKEAGSLDPSSTLMQRVPMFADYISIQSILAGLAWGVFFAPFARYFKFSATYKLTTENVLAIMALTPLATYLLERLAALHPALATSHTDFSGERGMMVLAAATLMTLGSGVSVFMSIGAKIKEQSTGSFWKDVKKAVAIDTQNLAIQQATHAFDDYEIVHMTLEHTNQSYSKAAKLLGIPSDAIHLLHHSKGAYVLVPEASQNVARRYRQNVACRDTLTGLLNRGGFLAEARKTLHAAPSATVYFLDLNKFKPVNDTYGHEAGDKVLQSVGERLKALFPQQSGALVTRLGGDEFCVLVPDTAPKPPSKAEIKKTVMQITGAIAEPFTVKGIKEPIHISTSAGVALYPIDGTDPETLIKIADAGMYGAKGR